MTHSKLTNGVEFRSDEGLEDSVRRALRDAFVAGGEATDTRSIFTAGAWADREAPKVTAVLLKLLARS